MARMKTTGGWLVAALLALTVWPAAAWALTTTQVSSVAFSSADKGYLSGGYGGGGMVSWTNDGGDSWHATILSNRFMPNVTPSGDGTNVTALTSYFNGVFKTSNFGMDWTTEPALVPDVIADFTDMAYLAGGRRVVVGSLPPSNQEALIASSVNNGAWNIDFQGPSYPAPNPSTDPPTTYAALSAIDAAPGGTVAWTVGMDWTLSDVVGPYAILIYKTANGGASWTTQTVAATTMGINCLAVGDAQTAFVGQQSRTLLRTLDGSTWSSVTLPAGLDRVKGIDALDANHVLVVGSNLNGQGRMAWSANAAAEAPTWVVNSTATTNLLLGAHMIDSTHWIVVGDNETVLRTSDGGTTWTGSKAAAAPSITRTSPTSTSSLDKATISIRGTSSDGKGVGVAKVQYRVHNKDGKYWKGTGWTSTETWVSADKVDPANGWDSWSKTISLGSAPTAGTITLWVRATDGMGLQTLKALGKEKVTTPLVPSSVTHTKSFKVSSELYPKHAAGTTAMKFTFKHLERGRWVTRKTVSAKASDYKQWTRCTSASVKLAAGKWTVQAKHTNPSGKTYTRTKSFTVK